MTSWGHLEYLSNTDVGIHVRANVTPRGAYVRDTDSDTNTSLFKVYD